MIPPSILSDVAVGLVVVLLALVAILTWLVATRRRDREVSRRLADQIGTQALVEQALRESEQRFRVLAETVPLGIVILQDGHISYANPAAGAIAGSSRDDLQHQLPWQFLHPDDRVLVQARGQERLAGVPDVPSHYEVRILRHGSEVRWCDLSVSLATLGGRPALVVVVFDITDERRAREVQAAVFAIDQAAHASGDLDELCRDIHAIVARLAPAENLYIALYDPETDLVSYPYFIDQVDSPPSAPEPLGKGLTSYVLRTGQPLLATAEVFARMHAAGEVEALGAPSVDWLGVPLRVRDRNLGVIAMQTYDHAVRYGEAEKELLVFVSNQIAQAIERKRSEQAVRESQRRLATLMSNLPGMAYRCRNDAFWTMEVVSEGCHELTGFTAGELLGNTTISYEKVVHPEDRQQVRREVDEAISRECPYELTYRIVTADGRVKWVWERGQGVFEPGRELVALEGFISDVTAARATTEALRQSEERYRLALQATQEIMYDWDIDSGRILWNAAVTGVLGWTTDEFGETIEAWGSFIHPEDATRVEAELDAAVAAGEAFVSEYRFRRKSGAWAFFLDRGLILRDGSGRAVRMVGAMSDLTTRRELEMHLLQAQKMEAVGQLAGGIAHDFNNLLTTMMGSTELAQRLLPADHVSQEELSTIHRTAMRAAELTRGLLAYARRQVLESTDLDLNDVIRQAIPLLRRMIPENVDISFQPDTDIGVVRGDRSQLTQVLVNLCVNARDVMPGGGIIQVETAAVTLRDVADREVAGIDPPRLVRLTVSDTGAGIPGHDLSHVFEPFFTTKEVGQGTGLGLSVVYGVIRQHNGAIDIDSQVGRGTTFTIHLPVSSTKAIPTVPTGVLPVTGGAETILVVEDEAAVRATLAQILRGLGYHVVEAVDGIDALTRLAAAEPRVDLVLTDVVMPRMGGKELYDAVRGRSNAPVFLFSSGYAENLVNQQVDPEGEVAFIGKPYGIDDLARKVRAVLDQGRNSATSA